MTDDISIEITSSAAPSTTINGSGSCTSLESKLTSLAPPPPEKIKCLIALFVSLMGTSFAATVTVFNNDRVPTSQPPLPDLFFEFFPRATYAFQMAECVLLVLMIIMAAVTFLHQHKWIILRRIFVTFGIMYFLRGICMYTTTLPNPHSEKQCPPPAFSVTEKWSRVFALFSRLGLSFAGQNYCGDLIFSGHSVSIIGLYLFIAEYTPSHQRLLRSTTFVLSFFAVLLVLMSREHYTIDVIVAYYLMTRMHWTYHTIANMPSLQKSTKCNLLTRSFLHPIVVFFEGNVGGPVPNEYISARSLLNDLTTSSGYRLMTNINNVYRS